MNKSNIKFNKYDQILISVEKQNLVMEEAEIVDIINDRGFTNYIVDCENVKGIFIKIDEIECLI